MLVGHSFNKMDTWVELDQVFQMDQISSVGSVCPKLIVMHPAMVHYLSWYGICVTSITEKIL